MLLRENRDLRYLVIGQFISAIGDQFYLIAIPWLVLQMTGQALIAGAALAVAGIPRALAMLLGGEASDRFSPKFLLIGSNGIQGIFVFILGLILLTPGSPLWPVFLLAFATGLIDAFGLPALNTLLPEIVEEKDLEGGNVYLQGINMVSGAVGPALAGVLISLTVINGNNSSSMQGMGFAFIINAVAFWVGISFFFPIRSSSPTDKDQDKEESLFASLPALAEFLGRDVRLRYMLIMMLTLGLFLTGTIRVGFALLADAQLSGNVQDLGNMTSAFGAGVLLGMVGRRLLPSPPDSSAGLVSLGLFSAVPLGLIGLGLVRAIVPILIIVLGMGLAVGYIMILLLSWLQLRTPRHLLGKVMAAVFFSTVGLEPLSQLLMGFLLDLNLKWAFISVGVLLLAVTLFVGSNRTIWSLETNESASAPS